MDAPEQETNPMELKFSSRELNVSSRDRKFNKMWFKNGISLYFEIPIGPPSKSKEANGEVSYLYGRAVTRGEPRPPDKLPHRVAPNPINS